MKNLLFVKYLFVLGLISSNVLAQSGKINGTVIDKTTGEPLAGVTVYIADIAKGASTNVDGEYSIISVSSGTYSLRFSYVGFSTVLVNNVEVFTGQTTTIDTELSDEILENEVVITAERPIVQKDQTTSVSFIEKETIEQLPALEVNDLVKFQPGVVTTSDGGLSFRGGRTREVAYIVDGVPVQDVYSQFGGNTVDVEVQSVQELQVLTGTFDAEIGGAQSGVVNITTRDPSDLFEASVLLRSGDFITNNNSRFIDGTSFNPAESKDISVTVSGPIIKKKDQLGFFFNGRYEDQVGYLKGERRFTPEDGMILDAYRFWYRNTYSPDDARLIAMDTARTPSGALILDSNGTPITFGSGDGEVVDMDWAETYTLNPKLVFKPASRTRITLNTIYNNREWQGYNDSKRYAPDGRNVSSSYTMTNILSLKQTLSNNFVFNLTGSYKKRRSINRAYDDFNDSRYQFFSDSDPTTGFYLGGTENNRSKFEEDQVIVSGDFTWQLNFMNEIKGGFQFRTNRFKSIDESLDWVLPERPDRPANVVRPDNPGQYAYFDGYLAAVRQINLERVKRAELTGESTEFEQQPIEFAAFLQEKLEFGSNIIVKTGIRYEYYDTREQYIVNTRRQVELIGAEDNLTGVDPKHYVSPRIGISFPISETGAFRVAYGHFTQMPAYGEIFKNPVDVNTNQGRLSGTTIGNPNLDPERTVKYELGLQQQISSFIGLDINLYYKNIRNLLGLEVLNTSDGVQYFRSVNRDYGLVKGGTIAFYTKPVGLLSSAGFDVTYQDARGSSSNPNTIADVIIAGRAGEPGTVVVDRQIIPLDWDQTLSVNASFTFGKPGNWSIGLINQIATGQPYTPTFIDPEKEFPENFFDNTENKPIIINLDLTAQKSVELVGTDINFKVQVNNLVNYLNQQTVFSGSGKADQIVRLPEDQEERSFVNDYVGLFSDHQDNVRPTWYSSPRQILFSIQFNL